MSLNNLSYIGHIGNLTFKKGIQIEDKPTTTLNQYGNMFEAQGVFAGGNDITPINQVVDSYLANSHQVKMVTLGLDSIFSASQGSPLGSGLESLGLLKYIKLESAISTATLPTPVSIIPKGHGGQSRG